VAGHGLRAGERRLPLRYRVRQRVNRWKAGEQPELAQTVVEGNADYSI
jgi:hypothetical protein